MTHLDIANVDCRLLEELVLSGQMGEDQIISLMRRRDQLRQFPPARLRCDSAIAPRSSGPLPLPGGRPSLRHAPSPCGLSDPKIDTIQRVNAVNGVRSRKTKGQEWLAPSESLAIRH